MRRVPVIVSAAFLTLFAVLFVYASLAPRPANQTGPLDPVRHLAAEEAKIRDIQVDPESVKFRNEFVSRVHGKPVVVCGEVNYKNSVGGYVGYQKFIWGPPAVQLFGSNTQADELEKQWLARGVRP